MVLGIDASNIKTGGGFTHLKELLVYAEPQKYGFEKVIIYGAKHILNLPKKPWIQFNVISDKDSSSILKEMFWRIFKLPKIAKKECDLLFCPGGIFFNPSVDFVSMSQNMLMWQDEEKAKFNRKDRLRISLMTAFQKRSFKNSKGIIFISDFASNYIKNKFKKIANKKSTIIPHGISSRFRKSPRTNINFEKEKINILYISTIHHYKYQWNLVEAVIKLRNKLNLNLHVDLIGGAMPDVLNSMKHLIDDNDFVHYHGQIPYDDISDYYHKADLFAFPSSCENMPNILIEAMSAGVPLASSNYGPMPEILKDGGAYFDPLIVDSISDALESILINPSLAEEYSQKAFHYASKYTWEKTADMTFSFLKECTK